MLFYAILGGSSFPLVSSRMNDMAMIVLRFLDARRYAGLKFQHDAPESLFNRLQCTNPEENQLSEPARVASALARKAQFHGWCVQPLCFKSTCASTRTCRRQR